MSPLYTWNGALLVQNSALATHQSCCCTTPTPSENPPEPTPEPPPLVDGDLVIPPQ